MGLNLSVTFLPEIGNLNSPIIELIDSINDVNYKNKIIFEAADKIKLHFYKNSELVSTANYYDYSHSRLVKGYEYFWYESLDFKDLISYN